MNIRSPRRILIFNVNWIGDVLFSTPIIRCLRRAFPDSYIACIVPPRCYPILEDNPHLNEIILFDEETEFRGLPGMLRFSRQLAAKKFDTVFLLHRSFSRALVTVLAGISQRIGYSSFKRFLLLTHQRPAPPVTSVHRIDYYLGVLEIAGLQTDQRDPELFVNHDDDRQVDVFLRSHLGQKTPLLIGINPGGNWGPKRWNINAFAELASRCHAEFGAAIIVTGGQQDVALVAAIRNRVPVISAAGVLTIKQFAALCRRLDVFVTADSGPLHIATAAGARRIIALFGPTDPALTGPRPQARAIIIQKKSACVIPCYRVACADNRCMQAIGVDDVLEAMRPYVRPR